MFDDIDPRSPIPLYAQIAARLRVAVAADELKAGDLLPSVRQLAATLRVNPATVVQAYRDLEREGFVEMRHGAGTYVQQVGAQMHAAMTSRYMEAAGNYVNIHATSALSVNKPEITSSPLLIFCGTA